MLDDVPRVFFIAGWILEASESSTCLVILALSGLCFQEPIVFSFRMCAFLSLPNTRAMLIHASKRWPGVVTIHLWPYELRMANQAYNTSPLSSHTDKQSPNEIFDNSAVDINQKHWKPIGCPAYVLKSELQGTTGIHPKWDARSRAGIYLGESPIHNRNVALVLNIHTGYVSPQFHVKFN